MDCERVLQSEELSGQVETSNRDHAHQHQYPGPDNKVIAAELEALCAWLTL